jgi:glycosyltransferase involved in cell wall biosynthesis
MKMRILHLSDSSLPDWRIEKAAISSKNRGYEVYFAGKKIPENHKSIFAKNLVINWNSRSRNRFPVYWHNLRKQMKKIIDEVKPDIIHAHNIFSAKMAKEIDKYPIVYDNHEYWSIYLRRQLEAHTYPNNVNNKPSEKPNQVFFETYLRNFLKSRYVQVWSNIEKDVVSSTPTITVSNTIVKDLEKIGTKVYLVPNFPLKNEIDWIPKPVFHKHKSAVYAGVEPTGQVKSMHRNLDGFIELFENGGSDIGKLYIIGWNSLPTSNVQFLGFLGRRDMYSQMQNHSIGIIPFRSHWSHIFISPNKAYEYAHAGLFVISSSGFIPVFDTLQNHCISFEDYDDLRSQLQYLLSDMDELHTKRIKTYEFARSNLLWENYESNIFEAYKHA